MSDYELVRHLVSLADVGDFADVARQELEALLTPEALSKFDEAEAQMTDRIIGGTDG
jgi:hypothetical protein